MQTADIHEPQISEKEISVYKCLAYFDVFNHPLTLEEIVDFCEIQSNKNEIEQSLNLLLDQGLISKRDQFYYLKTASQENIKKRISNNANAILKQSVVKKYSKLIAKFPYVQNVCISGSFSKGILEEDGDIDYFIITKPNRLWICRTLLVAFKKTVLLNSRKYFCVNYFIDSDNLNISDNNIFVATEIKTLVPMYNSDLFKEFIGKNKWVHNYFPNNDSNNFALCDDTIEKPVISILIQKILNTNLGETFDNFCFKLTLRRWKKKFPEFSQEDFDLNLRSRKNVSKHHPRGFQKKVLEAYQEKLNAIKNHL